MNQFVIVTGAAGYIGGITAIKLHEAGYRVIGIDRFECPGRLTEYFHKFEVGNFDSDESLMLIRQHRPVAIIHCAGSSLVGPSLKNPSQYYENNFVATKKLLDFLVTLKLKTRVIFSSSAATYGEPVLTPIQEVDPQFPINPYGESKLMVEMMLESYHKAYGLDYVALRYFNVCGAESNQRHGQKTNATHIIARILEAIKEEKTFYLNGDNFETEDGSCIRDYIHVEDVAKAHLLAIQHASAGKYNLSTSTGYSNKQIIETAQHVVGTSLDVEVRDARPGDPAILVGSGQLFSNETGWNPEHDLASMIKTAWLWYNRPE